MTDERLDQLLKKALVPEVTEEEIKVTGRKGTGRVARITRRICTGVAAAVGVLAVGIGTIAMVNPALASKLPLIGNIFAETQENLTFSGDYTENSTILNSDETGLVAKDNGFTISASESYCDGYSLYLTLLVEGEDVDFTYIPAVVIDYNEGNPKTAARIHLNGAWQNAEDTGAKTNIFGVAEGTVVDANTFAGMLKIDMPEALTRDTTINLEITKIGYDDVRPEKQNTMTESATYSFEGSWNLSIPVTAKTDDANVFTFEETVGDITLKTVEVTPYQVVVDAPQVFDDAIGQGSVVVFDQNDEKLQVTNGDGKVSCSYFAVQDKDISSIQVYVFADTEDWFSVYKGGTVEDARELAVISKTIDMETN